MPCRQLTRAAHHPRTVIDLLNVHAQAPYSPVMLASDDNVQSLNSVYALGRPQCGESTDNCTIEFPVAVQP